MIFAVDVAYKDSSAIAAGVLFREWKDAIPYKQVTTLINNVQDYIPGEFYRREMPCVLELLAQLDALPDVIVVDGFVYLGREHRAGLGKHVYDELKGKVSVIGVAKTPFGDMPPGTELYRGKSTKPLFVTSAGLDIETAKGYISEMHGAYRIPTLLKVVDRMCREQVGDFHEM